MKIDEPALIAQVRKKLGLNQHDAGAIFGGGANGFSRYEHGKAKPPRSLVLLFRLLDRHPQLIDEVTDNNNHRQENNS